MKPRVVMIDNFDSFTYNIVEYLRCCNVEVIVKRNTIQPRTIARLQPDIIVLSPGPGNPQQAGNLLQIIDWFAGKVSQFGVCLGMQAMIEVGGGSLRRLQQPLHGKSSSISHDGQTIFKGLPNPMSVGRYHSLAVKKLPENYEISAYTNNSKSKDGKVVMGIRQPKALFEGVQFHPESVLTMQSNAGKKLIRNVITCYA